MKKENHISLYPSEWTILEWLWKHAPQTVTQIAKAMEQEVGWAASTTKTLITRMEAKGYLRYEMGMKAREYSPSIDRSAVALAQTKRFLSQIYRGRLGLMVNALVEDEALSPEEISELRTILDQAERGKSHD